MQVRARISPVVRPTEHKREANQVPRGSETTQPGTKRSPLLSNYRQFVSVPAPLHSTSDQQLGARPTAHTGEPQNK